MACFGDKDNRKDWYEIENAQRKQLCQAIGLFTRRSALPKEKANAPDGLDFGSVQNLETRLSQDPGLQKLARDRAKAPGKVDRSTKFLGQPSLAINCGTAFLIAPDIIVTAAHCIFEKATTGFNQEKVVSDIQDWVFVLNYWYTNENTLKVLQKDIYHVKEIIFHTQQYNFNPKTEWRAMDDFAILRLAEPIKGVRPLLFSQTLPLPDTTVWSAGHGRGLPLKYREGKRCEIFVQDVNLAISCGITCFGGDSGSPLFNEQNEVVGLVTSVSRTKNKDNYEGYTLNSIGFIVPEMRPLTIKDYGSATWSYRLDCAQNLCTKVANLKATFHVECPKWFNGTFSIRTQKADIEVRSGLLSSFDAPIEVDCTDLLSDLDKGVLDLKEIRVEISSTLTGIEQPIFNLAYIELMASSWFSPADQVQFNVIYDRKNDYEVNKAYIFPVNKFLPDQRRIIPEIKGQLPN